MKLLFVVPHPIDPPDRGNKHHTLNILRRLAIQHDIDVIAFDEDSERSAASWERVTKANPRVRLVLRVAKNRGLRLVLEQIKSLLRLRPAVLGRYRSHEVFQLLESSLGRYDVVCFDMFMTAEGRAHCLEIPGLLLVTDAYSMMVHRSRMLPVTAIRKLRLIAEEWLLRNYERSAYPTFERLLVVSRVDIAWLAESAPGARCEFLPIPVEAAVAGAPAVEHAATVQPTVCCWSQVSNDSVALGVRDFLEGAWPEIRVQVVGARCVIWGKSPHPLLQRARSLPGVTFVEFVDDWLAYLRRMTVLVYPQRCGSGLQTKVQSAMALGLPCVLTPETVGGLPAIDGTTCLVRDSTQGLIEACTKLLVDASLRKRIGEAARVAVMEQHEAQRIADQFIGAAVAAMCDHRAMTQGGLNTAERA